MRHRETILITSALPYANGALHFGHIAGAYLPGDCYARFQRLRGHEVLYICGSDEYGVAITLSAELAQRTPREQVDFFHTLNRALFEKMQFSFDHYGRTSWEGHAPIVQDFFYNLQELGLIEEKVENHLYSEKERRFLADRYVVGTCPRCGYLDARGDECSQCAASFEATDLKNPRSKLTGSSLVLKPSAHLYLRFDRFKERLADWIQKKQWKENVVHFAMRYIEDLRPRAITRDSSWGVKVPERPDKVFYVWFDAPIGYISITQEWAQKQNDPERWKHFWLNPQTKLVQFIGKDNIPFHAVFFPAMLMGQKNNYKLPDEIPANEFLLLEGRQFSKSDGWTIDLDKFFLKYTADQARYVLAANAPESADAEFSWKDFQSRCNAELLGKFGNFVNRVLTFAKMHCSSRIPPLHSLQEADRHFLEQIHGLMERIRESYEGFHLRKACQLLMELAQCGNVYFDLKKPWLAVKNPGGREAMETSLGLCIDCIVRLALAASPMMPETAQKIWAMVGFKTVLERQSWQEICAMEHPAGQILLDPVILFKKIEDEEVMEEIAKLGNKEKETASAAALSIAPFKAQIQFPDIEKLDLRVAQIIEAEKVAKSKKLLKLLVDLGSERRTVVSGIALTYTPEQLIGKKVILVANLAPALIMGIESRGMILAGSMGADLELPALQTLAPGSQVF